MKIFYREQETINGETRELEVQSNDGYYFRVWDNDQLEEFTNREEFLMTYPEFWRWFDLYE